MLSRSDCEPPHQRHIVHTDYEHIQHIVGTSGTCAFWESCRRLTKPRRAVRMRSYHSILDLALSVDECLLQLFLGAMHALPTLSHLCL